MATKKVAGDPPAPGRAGALEADRVDPEHPKKPVAPVGVSTRPLAEAVRELIEFESLDVPVVSLYWDVPADVGQLQGAVAELKDLVKPIRERAASDQLSHEARMSVGADADRVLELQALATNLLGHTLAFFSCHHRGFEEAVLAPGGLSGRVEVDARPYVRPLMVVLEEARRYAVVVVDREHSTLFEFYLGVLEAREREDGRALRNPNFAAGDKEHSVHHRAQELTRRHYRDTADALGHFVDQEKIELVVVGGHHDTIPAFVGELPTGLRQKVVGTFVIDPNTMTPAEARDAAQHAVDEWERREEEQYVSQALERVAVGDLGAVGLEWCLLATNELAVDRLLIEAGAMVPGRMCDACGWLGIDEELCVIDGNPTRAVPDIVDEMVARVLGTSGHVEHVHADTALHDHLVAALLRFPVPRPDGTSS